MARATSPFALVKDHVLLRFASRLVEADESMSQRLTPELISAVVALIPDTPGSKTNPRSTARPGTARPTCTT